MLPLNYPALLSLKHIKPYWNADLSRLKREKIASYRTRVEAGRPRDPVNTLMVAYKTSKKLFAKTIRQLAKSYEADEICRAAKLAEVNRNSFWQLVKRCRNSGDQSNISITGGNGVVVNDVNAVLEVWKVHFTNLGTPKQKPNFDDGHFRRVTDFVRNYNVNVTPNDEFLNTPFTLDEIRAALKNLNRGKAAGYDLVTAEHVIHTNCDLIEILLILYNAIVDLEVIPICFRTGIQIPLFKGKDLDALDPNNYRGITLLSTFNKVFEILLWSRLKFWWTNEHVISDLQGACKTGLSCIHTAFILQETVPTSMEDHGLCSVSFLTRPKLSIPCG